MKTAILMITLISILASNAMAMRWVQCPEGSKKEHFGDYYRLGNGYSCYQGNTFCVNKSKCSMPRLSISCSDGQVQKIVTGYYNIEDGLSCPMIKYVCTSQKRCPQYSMVAPNACGDAQVKVTYSYWRLGNTKYSCASPNLHCVDQSQCPVGEY